MASWFRMFDARSSGPASGRGWGHCAVFLSKTLYSHGASLHPKVINRFSQA